MPKPRPRSCRCSWGILLPRSLRGRRVFGLVRRLAVEMGVVVERSAIDVTEFDQGAGLRHGGTPGLLVRKRGLLLEDAAYCLGVEAPKALGPRGGAGGTGSSSGP